MTHDSDDPRVRAFLWRLVGQHLFRWTLRGWDTPRRLILRAFGARVTPLTRVWRTVRIDRPWNVSIGSRTVLGEGAELRARAAIRVGDRCTVSQFALLTTEARDHRQRGFPTITAPITMEDDTWVACDALVLPGVHMREGAVLGARATADGSMPAWQVSIGQPARPIHARVIHPRPA